jgi:hypothetical protein
MSNSIPESVADKMCDAVIESICATIGSVFPPETVALLIPQIAEVGQEETRKAFCTICDLLGIDTVEKDA